MTRRRGVVATVLTLWLVLAGVVSCWVGKGGDFGADLESTIFELRLARTCVAILVGAALAVGGVLMQGLFRNPLASPSVLGTSAGASVGGQAALVSFQAVLTEQGSGWLHAEMFVPIGCLAGAGVALVLLLLVARYSSDLLVLLLTGFLLSSLFVSAGAFLTTLAQDSWELGRAVVSFTLGDLGGASLRQAWAVTPLVLLGVVYAWFWGRPLDLVLSGEDEAKSLGVPVLSVRFWTITWTAVLTAAAVSVAGTIGFVGLVVPHALRPWVGVKHRVLIPLSALGGGGFVVACDILCRVAPTQSELPLGVVTGLLGAPVFMLMLLRSRGVVGA